MECDELTLEARVLLGMARLSGFPFISGEEYLRLTAHYLDSDACEMGRQAHAAKVERRLTKVTASAAVNLFDLTDASNPLADIQRSLEQIFG